MELRALEYFVAVADERHMRPALAACRRQPVELGIEHLEKRRLDVLRWLPRVWRGSLLLLQSADLSSHTPVDGGLGVHVTLDLAGRMRFGPDVEWVTEENYAVDPRRADSFYARIRTYWPDLPDNALMPAYSGIRPKTAGQNDPQQDFTIEGKRHAGPSG